MKIATMCVYLSAVLAWMATTEGKPFEFRNYAQEFKEKFKEMAGGDNNPMVAAAQKMADAWGADEWQKKMHDTAAEMMKQGSETMQQAMQQWMQEWMKECEKMKAAGASKEEIKQKFMESMQKFQKMNSS